MRPETVFDESFLLSSTTLENGGQGAGAEPMVEVSSAFTYDKQGNPITTTVTTAEGEEEYEKKIMNVYGAADSTEERLGKVTLSTVTTQKTSPPGLPRYAHHTHHGVRVRPGKPVRVARE